MTAPEDDRGLPADPSSDGRVASSSLAADAEAAALIAHFDQKLLELRDAIVRIGHAARLAGRAALAREILDSIDRGETPEQVIAWLREQIGA